MSTEGNDPTPGENAGPDPTPDPAPTESAAPAEPSPPAPDPTPEPEPDPAPTPPPPPPPRAAESTASAPGPSAPAASFDVAAVPRSVWISAGGALVLLISVFFSWYTATASVSLPGGAGSLSRSASGSGWDSGDGAKLVALLALVILAVWAVDLFADNVTLPFPASLVALVLGAVALLVCVVKFFSKPGGPDLTSFGGTLHFSVSVAWGLYVAIVAAIAVIVGAYMHMNETSS
ncbi:MAG TPA: hypothetical protein VFD61_10450 [Gaiellales bacterium]|nr:hypothetical protein [Gaiellales bacterium]